MENQRPKLTDPQEFALIKSIYFEKDNFDEQNIDSTERWERMESLHRNLNNNSR